MARGHGGGRALELLSRASETDRRWILQHLSSGARARLTDNQSGPGARAGAPAAPRQILGLPETVVARLEAADPARMTELLQGEPGWLVSALLRAHEWPWAKKVVDALATPMRAEIGRLGRLRVSLAPAALTFVVRALSERADAAAPERQSPFDSLLARLGARRGR